MEELWKKFSLSEEEKGVLSVDYQDVERSKEHTQFSLLFRLQTNKEFNKEAFKSTLQKLRKGPHRVTIKEVGNNLFLAVFVTEEHMMDVLDRSPWSFDKRLVLLKRFEGDLSPSNVKFQWSPFWIRVFNIPIKNMNTTISKRIAKEIGTPLLIDAPKSGLAWGPFLRMRVDIDITKPLMRGKMVHIEDMEEGWVYFKYERLPIFCYCCEILGHQEQECPNTRRGCISVDDEDLQYRPWLRVVGPKVGKGKTSSSQPNTDEVSDEKNLEIEGNDGGKDQSLSCPQVLQLPPVKALNLQATNAELDTSPKTSENQVFLESKNQISNLKPSSAVVPISLSNSKPALIEIQPSLDSEKSLS